jgi:hypothetical protein
MINVCVCVCVCVYVCVCVRACVRVCAIKQFTTTKPTMDCNLGNFQHRRLLRCCFVRANKALWCTLCTCRGVNRTSGKSHSTCTDPCAQPITSTRPLFIWKGPTHRAKTLCDGGDGIRKDYPELDRRRVAQL